MNRDHRQTLLLHPLREPAPAHPAATLLLLRDGAEGLEVLMTRRSPQARFAPDVYVFPGGRVDAADAQAQTFGTHRPTQSTHQIVRALGAIRESFEELGILLARHADGRALSTECLKGLNRQTPLYEQCQAHGLRLCVDALYWLADWVTDREMPQRFDVAFFLARMPEGQEAVADEIEQFEPIWVRPQTALAQHSRQAFPMLFPTILTLEHLQRYSHVDAALQDCASETPQWRSCPRSGLVHEQHRRFMEHEPAYGELAFVSPDGLWRPHLDWQHETPVVLRQHLRRLTAPNPGAMTGPGTNSYIVGEARTGYIVIDPGPAIDSHVERLWQATAGDRRADLHPDLHASLHAIVCTHSHADHAPAAFMLQKLCRERGAPGQPLAPIWGMSSGPHAKANSVFQPDFEAAHGHVFRLQDGEHSHSLQVLHTPGHAANHLCLLLQEDGLLFSGDHVLNGSTTVIDPPDGDMSAYLDALDLLDACCEAHAVEFILPAHGHVLGFARQALARLKAHRLQREAQIARVMQAQPEGDLDTWLPEVYADVPESLWPVARRSLLAHVQRLQKRAQNPGLFTDPPP